MMKHQDRRRTIELGVKLSLSLGFASNQDKKKHAVEWELPAQTPEDMQLQGPAERLEVPLVAYYSRLSAPQAEDTVCDPVTQIANWIAQQTGGSTYAIPQSDGESPEAQPQDDLPDLLAAYPAIFLGYPEWWDTCPRAMQTFLQQEALKGKTILPFCVGGGRWAGGAAELRALCPQAQVADALCLTAVQVEEQPDQARALVRGWLTGLGYRPRMESDAP